MSPTWHNHAGNQSCEARDIVKCSSLQDLVELVQRAEKEGTTVRAVGAGHAWSDAALTEGYLVLPDNLSGLLDLDDGTLRAAASELSMARVLGGTHLYTLNRELEARGEALPQMGGYDGQTIAGVVSTSTHGSGLAWGPFPDFVRSLDIVVAGGRVLRVEPLDGPTDPERFRAVYGDGRRLVQNEDTFASVVCGMGCMGIVHSLVIDVREKFWLNEVRTLSTWEAVRDTLTEDGVLGNGDHYELFLNPYPDDGGAHNLLVTIRRDHDDPDDLSPDKKRRHPLTELVAGWRWTARLLRFLARRFPRIMVARFDGVLEGMVDDGYANISYKVFNIGEANDLPAISMELCVGIEDGRHLEAVDRMLAIAAEQRSRHRRYHTSPIALRFTAPSEAYASMMHGRASMIMELILVVGTRGAYDLLAAHEEQLEEFGVRAHWGQYNVLTEERIAAAYPRWDTWMEVQGELNSTGVFNSPFTKRVGISS